jgi:predicted AAA+ superfamily ATPase
MSYASQNYRRCLPIPTASFLLFGVRGIGKSYWIKRYLQSATVFDLRDEQLYNELLVNPRRFYQEVVGLPPGSWVVVDEVQRLPGLLNEVHRLIDKTNNNFALLGSSARKLRRGGVNLLGGRAESCMMYPLTPKELGEDFNLELALRFGSIPLVWCAKSPDTRLRAYSQTYLKEEIQAEALVRNLPGFARFLQIAALFHGQTLNIDGLARDSAVARTTVQGYIEILEDTLLSFRLRAYEGKLRVKEKKHPKLYFIDPGIVRCLKKSTGTISPEERGNLFEGFIIQLFRTYLSFWPDFYDDIYYWSTSSRDSKTEVDLLISRGSELIAIEIKSTERLQDCWFKGLRTIKELKKVTRCILLYCGERDFKTEDGIEVLGLQSFLHMLENKGI